MFVRVHNVSSEKRSLPTPFNTSVLLEPNEEADFIWSRADMNQILALMSCDFSAEITTQASDIRLKNKDIDLTEIQPVIDECVQLLIGTRICDDEGIHVSDKEKWADSESYEAFHKAYEEAIEKLENADSQEVVDEVKSDLESAKESFIVLPGTLSDED